MQEASRCLQPDSRKLGFCGTEIRMQTKNPAEGLICRHLPSSSLWHQASKRSVLSRGPCNTRPYAVQLANVL